MRAYKRGLLLYAAYTFVSFPHIANLTFYFINLCPDLCVSNPEGMLLSCKTYCPLQFDAYGF